ncbi:MAG: PD40 domain-containing protein [Verrucomicrobia bacterium]|nr:PD40 domain-containing protein [Verrucomicrobiota bacterium]
MNVYCSAFLILALCAATIHAQAPARTKLSPAQRAEEQALRQKYPWYQRDLFDESRRDLLEAALAGPMKADQEIVFACRTTVREHWYANFGYFAEGDSQQASVPIRNGQGRLCRLNLRTGKLSVLLEDPAGAVRDPCVHYDGGKIVFSYRKGGTDTYHLYTINSDGSGLRQLTDGPFDDIEPAYLPDGGIVFCSARSKRWVNCWCTPVATLHRCDGEGRDIRPLSANIEHDNTPAVLPDGRILYTRWEYVDRSQLQYHHLWTINPDGSGQMTFFGNMNPGGVFIDARPIPGTTKIVMIRSPGHGRTEHQGGVSVLDPGNGPDVRESERVLSDHPWFHDPYPVSADCFLVAVGDRLAMMNGAGRVNVLYRLPAELMAAGMEVHEPRWLTPRPLEPVITVRTDESSPTGTLILSDVYAGRNMAGVARGTVKNLLVMETLPKPLNFSGFPEPLTFGGSFTLERVLGTVPVESDGSAHFELPAHRAFFFVALDKDENAVKRMQSFVSVMPGEVTGCVGCHEERTQTAANHSAVRAATQRRPSRIRPIEGIPQVLDFPRDIQPILDRHCVSCHNPRQREGGVILSGDRGPLYSHSYYMLTIRQQFADGRNRTAANLPPYQIGAVASPLMKKLQGHHGTNLSPAETRAIRYWIEAGATYPGTYAALGTGMIGGYYKTANDGGPINQLPEVRAAAEVVAKRCAGCHTGNRVLPDGPCFDRAGEDPYWICGDRNAARWKEPQMAVRLRLSRHLLYNLSRPQDSVLLLAPLAREAGGYATASGDAQPKTCPPTFRSTQDADYRKILAAISKVSDELNRIKRFDMAGFRPRPEYLREMKRFGILPVTFDDRHDPADPYLIDAKYWQSFWHQQAKLH